MMKKSFTLRLLVYGLLCLAVACGQSGEYGNNPLSPGKIAEPEVTQYAKVKVTAENEYGEPVAGTSVMIQYYSSNMTDTTYYAYTDEMGIALFDSILAETVVVSISSPTGMPSVYFEQTKHLIAGTGYHTFTFLVPSGPIPLTVVVSGRRNRQMEPMANATISLVHSSGTIYKQVTTDSDGRAVMDSVDPEFFSQGSGSNYEVWFERHGLVETESFRWISIFGPRLGNTGLYTYESGTLYMNLIMFFDPAPPEILSLEPNERIIGPFVTLSCRGTDFDDGELPSDAFVWTSDREGELGTGSNIVADLSAGLHKITVYGIDSNGSDGDESSVYVYVSHFADGSYFPMPFDGYWKYRFDAASFSLTNEWGEQEQWMLDDMTVTIDDVGIRTCNMDWTIDRNGSLMRGHYVLTDNITVEGISLSISSTEERITVFDGTNMFDPPVEHILATTTYSPEYPFLDNYLNPATSNSMVTASTSISRMQVGVGSHTYLQDETLSITYAHGSVAGLSTSSGTFDTTTLTVTIGSVERMWYMVPNVGIVQFETTIAGLPVTGQLYETNIGTYTLTGQTAKYTHEVSQAINDIAVTCDRDRALAIRTIMRSLCPF